VNQRTHPADDDNAAVYGGLCFGGIGVAVLLVLCLVFGVLKQLWD